MGEPVWPLAARSAASRISSWMRASLGCCAVTAAGTAARAAAATQAAIILLTSLRVMTRDPSLSLGRRCLVAPPVVAPPLLVHRLEALALFGGEHLAHADEHQRAGFVHVRAGAFELVEVPDDRRLV